jgi:hypothetical protein
MHTFQCNLKFIATFIITFVNKYKLLPPHWLRDSNFHEVPSTQVELLCIWSKQIAANKSKQFNTVF